jgi:hypothetical protein
MTGTAKGMHPVYTATSKSGQKSSPKTKMPPPDNKMPGMMSKMPRKK